MKTLGVLALLLTTALGSAPAEAQGCYVTDCQGLSRVAISTPHRSPVGSSVKVVVRVQELAGREAQGDVQVTLAHRGTASRHYSAQIDGRRVVVHTDPLRRVGRWTVRAVFTPSNPDWNEAFDAATLRVVRHGGQSSARISPTG